MAIPTVPIGVNQAGSYRSETKKGGYAEQIDLQGRKPTQGLHGPRKGNRAGNYLFYTEIKKML